MNRSTRATTIGETQSMGGRIAASRIRAANLPPMRASAAGGGVPSTPPGARLRHILKAEMHITSDLAWLFGAGFAPWVALALSSRFGLGFSGGYLLSGALGTLLALFLNRQRVQGPVALPAGG